MLVLPDVPGSTVDFTNHVLSGVGDLFSVSIAARVSHSTCTLVALESSLFFHV